MKLINLWLNAIHIKGLSMVNSNITRSALAKIEVGQRHIYPDEIRHFKEILNVEYDDLFNV